MPNIYNLDRLSKEDSTSIAISLLYTLRGFPQYTITSELAYLLDQKSFINLLKYYGGKTIRIPSMEEIENIMKVLLLYQYYEVNHNSWSESLKLSGFTEDESNSARAQLSNFNKLLKTLEIGRG